MVKMPMTSHNGRWYTCSVALYMSSWHYSLWWTLRRSFGSAPQGAYISIAGQLWMVKWKCFHLREAKLIISFRHGRHECFRWHDTSGTIVLRFQRPRNSQIIQSTALWSRHRWPLYLLIPRPVCRPVRMVVSTRNHCRNNFPKRRRSEPILCQSRRANGLLRRDVLAFYAANALPPGSFVVRVYQLPTLSRSWTSHAIGISISRLFPDVDWLQTGIRGGWNAEPGVLYPNSESIPTWSDSSDVFRVLALHCPAVDKTRGAKDGCAYSCTWQVLSFVREYCNVEFEGKEWLAAYRFGKGNVCIILRFWYFGVGLCWVWHEFMKFVCCPCFPCIHSNHRGYDQTQCIQPIPECLNHQISRSLYRRTACNVQCASCRMHSNEARTKESACWYNVLPRSGPLMLHTMHGGALERDQYHLGVQEGSLTIRYETLSRHKSYCTHPADYPFPRSLC